jgi:PadR family transcriptional regulator, regulatory protein PadR
MRVDRIKGHLDLLLLGSLSHTPGHGYEVIDRLRERSDGALDLTEGSVYPALHRLEDLGLLASVWEPVAGRRRRIYRITAEGTKALTAERRDWRALVDAVESVLRSPAASTAGA